MAGAVPVALDDPVWIGRLVSGRYDGLMSADLGNPRHSIRYDAQGRPSCSVCGWDSQATGPQGVRAALKHSGAGLT